MKKRGFTLIELLAVIVILAIIALITVPMIMDTIGKAREQSLVDSAYGIIEAGEYFYAENILGDPNQTQERYDFEVRNKQFVYTKDNTKTLSFKGEVPKTGMLQINTNGKTAIAICNDTHCACKSVSELKVTLKESNCNIDKETGEIEDAIAKDGTPTGTVISYLAGNTAPDGYLTCDGSIYQISEYPTLAEAIKTGLGSYNYYGGDGVTTFAVPDLRGEFLRGTGTATRNTGGGSDVGIHQDATQIPYVQGYNNYFYIYKNTLGNSAQVWPLDMDIVAQYGTAGLIRATTASSDTQSRPTAISTYTSRPTNTSVLYCIKY